VAAVAIAGKMLLGGFGAATNACPVPGLVPGVCYPQGFPPTTRELVANWVGALPVEAREFFATPRTAADLLAVLKAASDAAWNTLSAAKATFDATSRGWVGRSTIVLFFNRWQEQLIDFRKRWDNRYAPKEALRAYLTSLPPAGPAPEAAQMETVRMVVSYLGLAAAIKENTEQTAHTIRSVTAFRANEMLDLERNLALSAEVAGKAIAGTVSLMVRGILKPLAQALIPAWLWWALILGGGVVIYGVLTGNQLVSAARRALR